MKNKLKYILSIFIVSFLSANLINQSKTLIVAQNVYSEFSNQDLEYFVVKRIDVISENNYNLIYVYNLYPQGFILVSGDDRTSPYIGYSFSNNFKLDDIPTNFSFVINNYKNNILSNIVNDTEQSNEVLNEWNKYLSDSINQSRERDVYPLIDAEFDQSGAWNNALSEFGFYGPVGCVAVSMSQIMHYWEYPNQGQGNNSYNEDDYGQLEIDFSTAYYDFDNMAATYATSASQQLLYHTGVSVNMDYDNSGSGASVEGVYPSAEYALQTFFNYSEDINVKYLENYSQIEFRNILKNELDLSRPILYSGYEDDDYNGGHAWNVDGYQSNNLHCNWGWGGWNNGYFNLTTMGGFEAYQTALLGIIPEPYTFPLALFEFEVNDMTVTLIDLSEVINDTEIESWTWNYGDGNTETNSYGFSEHTYASSGEYQTSLVVTNIYGYSSQEHIETIIIGSSLPGDINDDSLLNVLDIVMMVNFVLNTSNPTNSQFNASDINNDGLLNVLDVVMLVNLILG